ncbi:MAG TPA: cytochrome c [Candidatus Acidoferrales bacterium]|nr:cytochrome c [Candidatus Acidoferrales bacterium]
MIRELAAVALLTTVVVGTARAADAPGAFDKKCKMCHSVGGAGGPMAKNGGPLDGIGAKHDAEWFKGFLADPKSKNDKAKMPKVTLSPEEADAIVGYLTSLK